MANLELILSRLHKVKKSFGRTNHWTALCPAHDDRTPSLSIGIGADGILLKCFAGCETDNVAQALGLKLSDLFYTDRQPFAHVKTTVEPPNEALGLQPWAQRLWDDSKPLSGMALAYLESRLCAIPPAGGDLRWHDAVKHPSGYVGAALIGLVTHIVTNEPMSLHRTWITPNGKAGLDKARLLIANHPVKHGVIRLWADDAVTNGLGIAEGIETALSLAHEYQPVWAAISATNMGDLPVLDGIESIMIAVDTDDAGQLAAQRLGHRWVQAGKEAFTISVASGDLNDHVEVCHV